MKAKVSILLALILCMAVAVPAFAQSAQAERELQNVLRHHPDLAANPSLINNPTWQRNHRNVYDWFQKHPTILARTRQMGAWQPNGTWRDSNWWFQNDPNWVYQHHRDWIKHHPQWRHEGDWYEGKWHNRNWYVQNQPQWVKQHRPEWAKQEKYMHKGPPHGPPPPPPGQMHKGPPQGPPPGQHKSEEHHHGHGDQH